MMIIQKYFLSFHTYYLAPALFCFFPDFGVMEGLTLVDQGDSRIYMININDYNFFLLFLLKPFSMLIV